MVQTIGHGVFQVNASAFGATEIYQWQIHNDPHVNKQGMNRSNLYALNARTTVHDGVTQNFPMTQEHAERLINFNNSVQRLQDDEDGVVPKISVVINTTAARVLPATLKVFTNAGITVREDVPLRIDHNKNDHEDQIRELRELVKLIEACRTDGQNILLLSGIEARTTLAAVAYEIYMLDEVRKSSGLLRKRLSDYGVPPPLKLKAHVMRLKEEQPRAKMPAVLKMALKENQRGGCCGGA